MLLIIFLLIFSLLICENNYDLKKYSRILKKITFYLILLFIGFIFWKTQNRGTLYFYIIIFLSYLGYTIYSFKKVNIIKFFLIFLIPFILFNIEIKLKSFLLSKIAKMNIEKDLRNLNDDPKIYKLEKAIKDYNNTNQEILINNNKRWIMPYETSGRIEIWKKSLTFIKKNLFFGQGPQSDRNLLNKNASNILVYILLCGGIFSIIFFYIFV